MADLIIVSVPVLGDNYVHVAHEPDSGETAVIDPAVAEPVLAVLEDRGWRLTAILNTHHHHDHTGGNQTIKDRTGAQVVGNRKDARRIPGLDHGVVEGDTIRLGEQAARVIEVPGHTSGHIAFWFADATPDSGALFCGDTLFSIGCGRLFEGSPAQMWASLGKLRALPPTTRVYCAHEYTEANIRFALTVDPDNPSLRGRAEEVARLRARNTPTVPSILGDEMAANPFLRADDPALAARLGLSASDPVAVFTEVRERKDRF
ncbi:hydroxyacylglutathione hydrolase [Roseospira visakhapatnamensis]|uniref:Hydroxyacylglutathione hydrolase n=1 Tax=Roseospira visakhapatnamensis TaxID=390880 RepID=A0A7W6RAD0_9PROT|nr:hydroxyacylglutathione hydrolase [Roseospira visakhapatnamensis]MBB4264849.1 hydroxyacylglutathione hydrolase [Roseospira visakhapatnamensis]